MKHSIFLSYPKPFNQKQELYIQLLVKKLHDYNLEPRTLGVGDYNMSSPLDGIRGLMLECNGLLTIAFRRSYTEVGCDNPNSDINRPAIDRSNTWKTSPFCQIEPAMAYQIGLPVLIMREAGVVEEGMLEKGVSGLYMPSFDLDDDINSYFASIEFNSLLDQWNTCVKTVIKNKSQPPRLY